MTIDLAPDACEPANVGVQSPTTSGDLGGDLVESPLGLLEVDGAGGVGRLGARPFPDRDRYDGRQVMPRAFDHRVKWMAYSLSLKLWRIQQARHGSPRRNHLARRQASFLSSVQAAPDTCTTKNSSRLIPAPIARPA
jgi:hypothetical protein